MKKSNFPNHSGGVVQVVHTARYGAVPEALLEDRRLGLDSRAVAAWLAIKASGWQINVAYLRWCLALPGKDELGKDIWQRIATELESAGYLSRTKQKGQSGLWVWHITFNPVPCGATVAGATVAGSAGYGGAVHGAPTYGSADDGQPGHKPVPRVTVPTQNTTTNKLAASGTRKPRVSDDFVPTDSNRALLYPIITCAERDELEKLISFCAVNDRQDVLDEIEGIRQGGGIKKGVVPLARALISKAAIGEFVLSAGQNVRAQRDRRNRNELAIAASTSPSENFLAPSEKSIAQLPPNLQIRMRAAKLRAENGGQVIDRSQSIRLKPDGVRPSIEFPCIVPALLTPGLA